MDPNGLSLARLLNSPLPVSVPDAVALIVQLAQSPQVGRPSGARLSADHVWLAADGSVVLSPGVFPTRAETGALLGQLLSVIQETHPESVPHALRFIVDRAAGQLADITMPSLTAFATALEPFQPADPAAAVRALVAATQVPPPVTPPRPQPAAVVAQPVAIAPPPARRWGHRAVRIAAACAIAALLGARAAREMRDDAPVAAAAPTVADPRPAMVPDREDLVMTIEPARDATASVTATAPAASKPVVTVPAVSALRRPEPLVAARSADADAVYSPSFAGSGSAVFFHAETASGSALKRAEAGVRGELRIATIVDDGARNYHVQLSPSGKTVAFDSDRDGVRGVYLATAEGRNVRRVSGPGYAAVPTWAPDGDRLAFIRGEVDRPAVWNVWLLDLETGRQSRVTSFRRGQVWGATWFADGRRIAFSHEDRLTIHDLASGEARGFASPIAGRQVRTPAVSPDGRWIVFQVVRDGVWLLDVQSGSMRCVLQDPLAEEFAWSPDGSRVAYHSRRSGGWGLWTMAGL
jgi:hypothetical protein